MTLAYGDTRILSSYSAQHTVDRQMRLEDMIEQAARRPVAALP